MSPASIVIFPLRWCIVRSIPPDIERPGDMVHTPRRFGVVAMLAKERLSVRGHAGLVLNPITQRASRLMNRMVRAFDSGSTEVRKSHRLY